MYTIYIRMISHAASLSASLSLPPALLTLARCAHRCDHTLDLMIFTLRHSEGNQCRRHLLRSNRPN